MASLRLPQGGSPPQGITSQINTASSPPLPPVLTVDVLYHEGVGLAEGTETNFLTAYGLAKLLLCAQIHLRLSDKVGLFSSLLCPLEEARIMIKLAAWRRLRFGENAGPAQAIRSSEPLMGSVGAIKSNPVVSNFLDGDPLHMDPRTYLRLDVFSVMRYLCGEPYSFPLPSSTSTNITATRSDSTISLLGRSLSLGQNGEASFVRGNVQHSNSTKPTLPMLTTSQTTLAQLRPQVCLPHRYAGRQLTSDMTGSLFPAESPPIPTSELLLGCVGAQFISLVKAAKNVLSVMSAGINAERHGKGVVGVGIGGGTVPTIEPTELSYASLRSVSLDQLMAFSRSIAGCDTLHSAAESFLLAEVGEWLHPLSGAAAGGPAAFLAATRSLDCGLRVDTIGGSSSSCGGPQNVPVSSSAPSWGSLRSLSAGWIVANRTARSAAKQILSTADGKLSLLNAIYDFIAWIESMRDVGERDALLSLSPPERETRGEGGVPQSHHNRNSAVTCESMAHFCSILASISLAPLYTDAGAFERDEVERTTSSAQKKSKASPEDDVDEEENALPTRELSALANAIAMSVKYNDGGYAEGGILRSRRSRDALSEAATATFGFSDHVDSSGGHGTDDDHNNPLNMHRAQQTGQSFGGVRSSRENAAVAGDAAAVNSPFAKYFSPQYWAAVFRQDVSSTHSPIPRPSFWGMCELASRGRDGDGRIMSSVIGNSGVVGGGIGVVFNDENGGDDDFGGGGGEEKALHMYASPELTIPDLLTMVVAWEVFFSGCGCAPARDSRSTTGVGPGILAAGNSERNAGVKYYSRVSPYASPFSSPPSSPTAGGGGGTRGRRNSPAGAPDQDNHDYEDRQYHQSFHQVSSAITNTMAQKCTALQKATTKPNQLHRSVYFLAKRATRIAEARGFIQSGRATIGNNITSDASLTFINALARARGVHLITTRALRDVHLMTASAEAQLKVIQQGTGAQRDLQQLSLPVIERAIRLSRDHIERPPLSELLVASDAAKELLTSPTPVTIQQVANAKRAAAAASNNNNSNNNNNNNSNQSAAAATPEEKEKELMARLAGLASSLQVAHVPSRTLVKTLPLYSEARAGAVVGHVIEREVESINKVKDYTNISNSSSPSPTASGRGEEGGSDLGMTNSGNANRRAADEDNGSTSYHNDNSTLRGDNASVGDNGSVGTPIRASIDDFPSSSADATSINGRAAVSPPSAGPNGTTSGNSGVLKYQRKGVSLTVSSSSSSISSGATTRTTTTKAAPLLRNPNIRFLPSHHQQRYQSTNQEEEVTKSTTTTTTRASPTINKATAPTLSPYQAAFLASSVRSATHGLLQGALAHAIIVSALANQLQRYVEHERRRVSHELSFPPHSTAVPSAGITATAALALGGNSNTIPSSQQFLIRASSPLSPQEGLWDSEDGVRGGGGMMGLPSSLLLTKALRGGIGDLAQHAYRSAQASNTIVVGGGTTNFVSNDKVIEPLLPICHKSILMDPQHVPGLTNSISLGVTANLNAASANIGGSSGGGQLISAASAAVVAVAKQIAADLKAATMGLPQSKQHNLSSLSSPYSILSNHQEVAAETLNSPSLSPSAPTTPQPTSIVQYTMRRSALENQVRFAAGKELSNLMLKSPSSPTPSSFSARRLLEDTVSVSVNNSLASTATTIARSEATSRNTQNYAQKTHNTVLDDALRAQKLTSAAAAEIRRNSALSGNPRLATALMTCEWLWRYVINDLRWHVIGFSKELAERSDRIFSVLIADLEGGGIGGNSGNALSYLSPPSVSSPCSSLANGSAIETFRLASQIRRVSRLINAMLLLCSSSTAMPFRTNNGNAMNINSSGQRPIAALVLLLRNRLRGMIEVASGGVDDDDSTSEYHVDAKKRMRKRVGNIKSVGTEEVTALAESRVTTAAEGTTDVRRDTSPDSTPYPSTTASSSASSSMPPSPSLVAATESPSSSLLTAVNAEDIETFRSHNDVNGVGGSGSGSGGEHPALTNVILAQMDEERRLRERLGGLLSKQDVLFERTRRLGGERLEAEAALALLKAEAISRVTRHKFDREAFVEARRKAINERTRLLLSEMRSSFSRSGGYGAVDEGRVMNSDNANDREEVEDDGDAIRFIEAHQRRRLAELRSEWEQKHANLLASLQARRSTSASSSRPEESLTTLTAMNLRAEIAKAADRLRQVQMSPIGRWK